MTTNPFANPFAKSYDGPVRAVILDWAGTVVDFGSRAPMGVFVAAFGTVGVTISAAEARVPMGLPKWDHIKAIGALPEVAKRWRDIHGRPMSDGDVDDLYARFLPMNVEVVADHAALVPGARTTIADLRARGVKIGSTTGYSRPIMDVLIPAAAANGYEPDCVVCAGDLAAGRPTPLMCYQNMVELNVWPAAACVKVDDTLPGIEEGLHAGMWTVAVALTGNEMGLAVEELTALSEDELKVRRTAAYDRLRAGGAHYVIDGIGQLIPVIEDIERRLALGAVP
ncbi:phosphonoacetaldehyde hydrolase [Skermanella pratensis]|uniref:phosphonoacetaldehyde hydrolase n=1 Tax=Skermanella pratensis TaxID=2233999 RepID=UPI00130199A8|nr:phosphonoacetaldehyde hydrolase [Skermanella pratensis]